MNIGNNIKQLRQKKNLTQDQVAEKLGISYQAVSKWENNANTPDISLLPQIANLFDVSIDALFSENITDYSDLNHYMKDDDVIRIVQMRGTKVLKVSSIITRDEPPIEIAFPRNCNDRTQYFKVEVFGNLYCDASINGDVLARGNIECNQINGEYIKCIEDSTIHINCNIINSDVRTFGDVRCTQINGDAACFNGGNLICEGNITGNANTFHGGNISCGGSIIGDVSCSNNVECKTIEGSVECQGRIVYK